MLQKITKALLSAVYLAGLVACTNNAGEQTAVDTAAGATDTGSTTGAGQPELAPVDASQYYIWTVDANEQTKSKNPELRPTFYNVDSLIAGLNERFPKVKMEKKSMGHDTLYTEIKDARYLADGMGSAGAEAYIAQAVLNLTEVKGVNYVRIEFTAGNHAEPDVWSKQAFAGYREKIF